MRLLVINPNTSKSVTARIRGAVDAASGPGDRFTTLSAAFGPELIVTDEDAARATGGVIEAARRFDVPVDGIVLASFGDTGAREVRVLRPSVPVVGIASAAFAVIHALDGPFGIVTFAESVAPGLHAKAVECGLGPRLLDIAYATKGDFGDPGTVQERYFDQMLAQCEALDRRGARAIVLGGGPLAGLADALAPHCSVPLVDGTRAAVNLMRALTHDGSKQFSLTEARGTP